jgi:hypothetical protein
MKFVSTLNETIEIPDLQLEGNLGFDDLLSSHIGALKAIDENRFDMDKSSSRMIDTVYELQDYGLVDGAYELTTKGKEALNIAHAVGGSKDRRTAKMNKEQVYDDAELAIFDTDHQVWG